MDLHIQEINQISETLNPAVYFLKLEEINFLLQVLKSKLTSKNQEYEGLENWSEKDPSNQNSLDFIEKESSEMLLQQIDLFSDYIQSVHNDLKSKIPKSGLRGRLIDSLQKIEESPLKGKRFGIEFLNERKDRLDKISEQELKDRNAIYKDFERDGITHPLLPHPFNKMANSISNSENTNQKESSNQKSDLITQSYLEQTSPWAIELLNYKIFAQEDYFQYSPFKDHLQPKLTQAQCSSHPEKLIFTDFTLAPRTLIPDVANPDLFTSPAVSMNWPDLVYISSSENKKQALLRDQRALQVEETSFLNSKDRFSLALMNMLWDLKLSKNPGLDMLKLLSCEFWSRVTQITPDSKLDSIHLDVEAYNQALFDPLVPKDLYTSKFDKIRKLKRDLNRWQELVNVRIPDLYSKTKDEYSKLEIQKFWDFAKREYAEKLRFYKNNFIKNNSFFANNKFRDLERELVSEVEKEYKMKNQNIDLEERKLQSQEDVRIFAQNNLLKMSIYVTNAFQDFKSKSNQKFLLIFIQITKRILFSKKQKKSSLYIFDI